MSSHTTDLVVNGALEFASDLVRKAAIELGFIVQKESKGSFQLREDPRKASMWTYPATVEVTLVENNGSTQVSLTARNFYFGPIQAGHVQDKAEGLRTRIISLAAPKDTPATAKKSLADELEGLAKLFQDGLLTSEEFVDAKGKVLNGK